MPHDVALLARREGLVELRGARLTKVRSHQQHVRQSSIRIDQSSSEETLHARTSLCFDNKAPSCRSFLAAERWADTELVAGQCDTLRRKFLKTGAVVRVTVRKVWIAFPEICPYQELFAHAYRQLVGLAPLPQASPG